MFNFVCKVGSNEAFLAEGVGLSVVFKLGCQKLHFLHDVAAFLVILAVVVDVCKESPVIKVINGILKEGVAQLVAPKAMTEPGGEQLH